MDLHENLRDYTYGSASRCVHIIVGLPSICFSGASVTWIATPRDYRSVS